MREQKWASQPGSNGKMESGFVMEVTLFICGLLRCAPALRFLSSAADAGEDKQVARPAEFPSDVITRMMVYALKLRDHCDETWNRTLEQHAIRRGIVVSD